MINFPDSPTVGQQFTSGGKTWQWDGTKWVPIGGGPFLPLTGGVLSGPGNLALGGLALQSPVKPGALFANVISCGQPFSLDLGQNIYYDQTNWRANGTGVTGLVQLNSGGLYFYNSPSTAAGAIPTLTNRLTIDASGNLTIPGSLNGSSLSIGGGNGTITSPGVIAGTSLNIGSGASTITGGNITTSGTVTAGSAATSPSGNLQTYNTVTVYQQSVPTNYLQIFGSGGAWYFYNNSPLGGYLMQISSAGDFTIAGNNAYKPGGGPWITTSDRRLKDWSETYTIGLDEICRLRPVRYRYNGRARMPAGQEFVGLHAEEVQQVMAEMVGTTMVHLDPDDAEDTEVLTVDTGPLIYALCNAVRELRDQIAALKAA